ncbi:redoxin family protein [Fusobacterium sp.]|uniref:redoxin family protein n=1 Tax=Fusobacterium sp. TaxID=68766 RepID=UPI00260CEB7F|nr:redoxin family protein [Fusobacterium sp.]
MKSFKTFFLLTLFFIIGMVSYSREVNLSKLKLKDIDGQTYSFTDTKNEKYVKLWASWCPVCLYGLDELEEMGAEERDYDIITVVSPGIVGEKNTEDFKEWYNSLGYKNIKVLLDEKGEINKIVKNRVYPTSVILDENGNIKQVIPGHLDKIQIDSLFSSNSDKKKEVK